MLFNSHAFLFVFLPAALLLLFVAGKVGGIRAALSGVVVASLGFYAYWDPRNLLVLLPSMGVNFLVGRALATGAGRRRLLCAAGVIFNLCVLGWFKYADFAISSWNAAAGDDAPLLRIVLPLGVSFFTFEQIAWVVDAYRKKARAYSFREYCAFVTFFPHLIAGPIIQHDELIEQWRPGKERFVPDAFAVGIAVFIVGLFKKVVVADTIALHVTPVYDGLAAGGTPTLFTAWLATIGYSLQLYFDFSGYSDMAIGLARMLGVKLPANFDSPYQAHNPIEFWRRWHMTLSRFLKNYLYIPLGGNQGGKVRRYVNLLVTMLLGGLWHGAGWGFVIWGGLNGVFLVVNHAFRKLRGAKTRPDQREGPWWIVELSIVATFLAVTLSRVFFRAPDLESSLVMFRALGGAYGVDVLDGLRAQGPTVLLFAALWLFCRAAPNTQQVFADHGVVFGKVRGSSPIRFAFTLPWACALAAAAFASVLLLTRVSEFIYFQF
jgi:alginate O-acetyltransferase complex protein AlgI